MLDALAVDQFLKRYARRLARRLSGATGPAPEVRLTVPLDGVMSVVRVLEVDDRPRAVVRVYDHPTGRDVAQRLAADVAVWRHGLDAPRVLDVAESRRVGAVAVAETFVSGEHPRPETMDALRIEALARTFARLHDVTRPEFGPIGRRVGTDFAAHGLGRVRNRSRSVSRWAPAAITADARRQVLDWFERNAGLAAQPEGYSLTHDKPNRGNLIWVGDEARFCFVDLATLQFGAAAKDLVQVCHEILGNEAPAVEAFLEAYFAARETAPDPDAYGRRRAFWHAYYHLSQCAINCRRLRKSRRGGEEGENYALKAVNHWRRIVRILDETR